MDPIKVIRFAAFVVSIHLISYLLEVHGTSLKHSSFNTHHRKTIKTECGHIYDCVDIYKQPAFQHPLLKDHKIQTGPSFSQQKEFSEDSSSNNVELGLKEECPPGTVPIRRTTKKERLQSKNFFRTQFQRSDAATNGDQSSFRISGIYITPQDEFRYVKAGGYVSTHNPVVNSGQLSASIVTMDDGSGDDYYAFIRVGWVVSPDLFNGDNRTHLFANWGQKVNGKEEGCINTMCPGFVQVHPKIPIDLVIDQISSGHEADGYVYINIGVFRDDLPKKDWWIVYGHGQDQGKMAKIGYYPDSLFPIIKDGFQSANWGGYVESFTPKFPMMGNGLVEDQAAHFRRLWARRTDESDIIHMNGNANGNTNGLIGLQQSACYKAGGNSYKEDQYWKYNFWFGGAAGDVEKCPN